MSVTRCFSSHLMSGLLAWRNPQGREEGWFGRYQGIENRWIHFGKVAATQVGLSVLNITSTVETVAYGALASLSLFLYPVTDRPYKFFGKLLESSSFTVIWTIVDLVIYNPLALNVMTQESFARYWAKWINPTSIAFFRLEDRLYVADWEQQYRGETGDPMLRPILAKGRTTQESIDRGSNFIREEVLRGASPETLESFKNVDSSIVMFILTKAVSIYVFGSKMKEKELPKFFKTNTHTLISALRLELNDEKVVKELSDLMQNPTEFEKMPTNEATKSAFNSLRNIAAGEFDGLFVTRCWQKASQQLS